jgi:23S rRNA (pseudouridine1915-N3)-methyltransferase
MLKLRIIVVGRTKSTFLLEGEAFFQERLKRYAQLEWSVARPAKMRKGKPEKSVLAEEGCSIVRRLPERDYLIALDRRGRQYDSEGLARWLNGLLTISGGSVSFVIGGHLGLCREILDRADQILSLSRLTLTHEMIRLVLLEQLYRAFTILHGEKYHK